METFSRDLRYAVRMLVREPGFSLLALLALALGTGATTAIFTVVHAVLLRPLSYRDPGRLIVALHGPEASGPVSPADFFDYRRDARAFERLSAAQMADATLTGGERPERVNGLQVTSDLFELLGVPPLVGRTFTDDDARPGHEQVVVLGYALWQRKFGGDRAIVGRTVNLNGAPTDVVGVMPPDFQFAPFWGTRAELWTPLVLSARLNDRGGRSLRVFGRLRPGATVAQAQADMTAIAARLAHDYPKTNAGLSITVRPLLDKVVAGIRPTLVALMGMVTFVLLIACANVANSRLARASGRVREMALRAAMGATQGRIVRQLLTESLVLAVCGSVLGLALAVAGVHWLLATLPPGSLPRQHDVGIDGAVFTAAALTALVATLATGLAPALHLLRTDVAGVFQEGGRGTTDGTRRTRGRGVLVAIEAMLALTLLAGAALMGRTMINLRALDPGFRVDHLAVASVSLAGTPDAQPAAREATFDRIRESLARIPGVTATSAINHLPLAGDLWTLDYTVEGRPAPSPSEQPAAAYRIVEPGYFAAMGLHLIAGRDIASTDTAASIPVVVINRTMADHQWPGDVATGKRILLPGPSRVTTPITVVGVVADARQSAWTAPPNDEVYLAFPQRASEFGLSQLTFVLRTATEPEPVANGIVRQVAAAEPAATVSGAMTMARVVADGLWQERLVTALSSMFAAVALVLVATGVFAVVAYAVARRTREFGVRVALGATRGEVRRLALGEALRPILIGCGLGLLLAAAGVRLLQGLLFQVAALDPVALAVATLCLLAAAALAAWLPARRASRLDPVVALRHD